MMILNILYTVLITVYLIYLYLLLGVIQGGLYKDSGCNKNEMKIQKVIMLHIESIKLHYDSIWRTIEECGVFLGNFYTKFK